MASSIVHKVGITGKAYLFVTHIHNPPGLAWIMTSQSSRRHAQRLFMCSHNLPSADDGRLEPEFRTSRPRVSGPGANSSRSSIRSRRREGHVPCGGVGAARDEGLWAEKGERTPTRLSYHSGYYGRMLVTCVSNFGAPGAARYRLGWVPEHSRRRARQSRSLRRLGGLPRCLDQKRMQACRSAARWLHGNGG